ncbi:type II secretion system F family protein [Candidatus Poriferisodalis sp.]|uniref:type II secretion system F family protein n=1 Tax=Candidatus Poriferisodalis sp. TaxID=3101277 RepID=UPI003AF59E47
MIVQVAAIAAAAGIGATLVIAGVRRQSVEIVTSDQGAAAVLPAGGGVKGVTHQIASLVKGDLERKHLLLQDAAMIGRSLESHGLGKLGGMAGAAILVALVGVMLNVAVGVQIPLLLLVAIAAGAALLGWWLPDSLLKTEAEAERVRFQQSTEAWLELVAQLVTAGSDTHAALGIAATYSSQPAFVAIRDALNEASARAEPPWEGLRRMADARRLRFLDPFIAALELAGTTGAGARQSILSQVDAARSKSLHEADAKAASASEKMGAPLALIGGAFMMLMGYPPLASIADTSQVAGL